MVVALSVELYFFKYWAFHIKQNLALSFMSTLGTNELSCFPFSYRHKKKGQIPMPSM